MIEILRLTKFELSAVKKELVAIEQETFLQFGEGFDINPWGEKEFEYELPRKFELSCVGKQTSDLFGFSICYAFKEDYAHISRLVIRPAFHGKKLGQHLLKHQLELLLNLKFRKCSIDLIKNNTAALSLYTRAGFMVLQGEALSRYVAEKNREEHEYLGENPSHLALIKSYETI